MKQVLDNEHGAVLITGMMILLILTLIGITAMQSSTLEEVMSRNNVSRNVAFNAAEAALREGERILEAAVLPTFTGTSTTASADGLYQSVINLSGLDWDATDSAEYSGASLSGVASDPRYIIESLGTVSSEQSGESIVASTEISDRAMYRITAYGVGTRPGTIVILQTTYVR